MVEPAVSFQEFVGSRSPTMLRSAYLLTGDRDRAEDLLQTALAKTWPRWSRVNRDGTGEAYVRRVMYTTYATWWRRRWRAEVPTAAPPDRPATDAYRSVDERTELMRALGQLSAGQRAVVVLRFFEDRTAPETAAVLATSTVVTDGVQVALDLVEQQGPESPFWSCEPPAGSFDVLVFADRAGGQYEVRIGRGECRLVWSELKLSDEPHPALQQWPDDTLGGPPPN